MNITSVLVGGVELLRFVEAGDSVAFRGALVLGGQD